MIIVEGPDGAGKSTLVKQLCLDLDLTVGERAVKNRDELWKSTRQDTYTALSEAVGGNQPVKVWDRLFFSEFVYHRVVGRECEFTLQDEVLIRKVLNALVCPIIFCLPPFPAVKENVLKDKQMDGVVDNIVEIYDKYVTMMKALEFLGPHRVMHYNYMGALLGGGVEYDTILVNCHNYIEERAKRTW